MFLVNNCLTTYFLFQIFVIKFFNPYILSIYEIGSNLWYSKLKKLIGIHCSIHIPYNYQNILFLEQKVSAATFCKAFPFHLMFNKDLKIIQTGCTMARIIPSVTLSTCTVNDILDTVSKSYQILNTCADTILFLFI